jgi:hypothetical protein
MTYERELKARAAASRRCPETFDVVKERCFWESKKIDCDQSSQRLSRRIESKMSNYGPRLGCKFGEGSRSRVGAWIGVEADRVGLAVEESLLYTSPGLRLCS